MEIEKLTKTTNILSNPKISSNSVVSLALRTYDQFALESNYSKIQRHIKKLCEEVWSNMGLDKEIMPLVEFKPLPLKCAAGADTLNCKIIFPDNDIQLIQYLGLLGGSKTVLAHELQHINQMYAMARFLGVEKLDNLLSGKKNQRIDYDFLEFVVSKTGRIEPGTQEAKYAKKCLKAHMSYPDLLKDKNPIKNLIRQIRYYNNFLEKDARKKQKSYREFSLFALLFKK